MVEENSLPKPCVGLLKKGDGKKTRSREHSVTFKTTSLEEIKFLPNEGRNMKRRSTTDWQTFSHLVKSTLGSGMLAMPYAFRSAGIVGGIFGGLFLTAVCSHTAHILVSCAHVLSYRTKKSEMDYPDVVEAAFATGPARIRQFNKVAWYIVEIGIFTTYFLACSADNLIIATNYGQVIRFYTSESIGNSSVAENLATNPIETSYLRQIMACLMLPLILLVWVPDLKYLAPVSTIANVFMCFVLGITVYYSVEAQLPMDNISLFRPIVEFPTFFIITLFALENIGVIMPLENNMKTPQNFLGFCGVLNIGMCFVSVVYITVGVLGYMGYGEHVYEIVTANLPVHKIPAQIAKILIGTTVLLTFSLQFYVCRDMAWKGIKHHFPNHPLVAEYLFRTVLVIVCVSIALCIPQIDLLMNLVGALGFSLLGIIVPAVIELVTYWNIGYGRFSWKMYKNICLIFLGIIAVGYGCYKAILSIVDTTNK